MPVAYKLTDENGYTRAGQTGETHWAVGDVVHPTGSGSSPCGPGVLHGYSSPEVAALGDPIHAGYGSLARLFRISSDRPWETDGLKRWTTGAVTVLEELPLSTLTFEERIAWAIVLTPHSITQQWAVHWLGGVDRSVEAALTARTAADAAAGVSWSTTRAIKATTTAAAALFWAPSSWDTKQAVEFSAARAAVWGPATAYPRTKEEEAQAEAALMPALTTARAILAGTLPAEKAWDKH